MKSITSTKIEKRLWCWSMQSNKTVQRTFVKLFRKEAAAAVQIWNWHKNSKEGFLFRYSRAKGFGQPSVCCEIVYKISKRLYSSVSFS